MAGVNEMLVVNGVNGEKCRRNEGQECGEQVETAGIAVGRRKM